VVHGDAGRGTAGSSCLQGRLGLFGCFSPRQFAPFGGAGVAYSNDGAATTTGSPRADSGLLTNTCYQWVLSEQDKRDQPGQRHESCVLVDRSAPIINLCPARSGQARHLLLGPHLQPQLERGRYRRFPAWCSAVARCIAMYHPVRRNLRFLLLWGYSGLHQALRRSTLYQLYRCYSGQRLLLLLEGRHHRRGRQPRLDRLDPGWGSIPLDPRACPDPQRRDHILLGDRPIQPELPGLVQLATTLARW